MKEAAKIKQNINLFKFLANDERTKRGKEEKRKETTTGRTTTGNKIKRSLKI